MVDCSPDVVAVAVNGLSSLSPGVCVYRQRRQCPMTATTPSTSRCCWLAWASCCHTTASSPTWTTCTTNTQVGPPQWGPAVPGWPVHSALALLRLPETPGAAPCQGSPCYSNPSYELPCDLPGQPLTLSGLSAPLGRARRQCLAGAGAGGRCRGWGSPEPLPPLPRPHHRDFHRV